MSLGVRVCVADLTEAELERVIESESGNARTIGLKLAGGVDAEVLVSSLSGPLRSWMTFHIGSSSRNLSWEQFLRHVQTVLQNLRAIGCESFECLTGDLLATSRIVAFRASLAEAVSERKGRPRTEAALSHDANLLYQVEESRKRNPATDFKPWPGAVIITTDTFLDLTYRDVSGSDAVFPVAASAAQLATVVSESVEPATAELLVETASREILSGGLLQRAARIPTEAAIELANALSGGSASDPTDVQLTLDELLRDEAGLSGSETQIRNAVNAAITRRALWTNRALEEHRTRTRGYEEAAEIRVQVSTETEANLTTQNHSLTELVQRSGATNEQLLAELRAKSEEVLSAEERTKQQLRRVGVGAVPTLLCVAIGTYIFLRPSHWAAKLLFLASAAYLLFEVAMYVSDHNARARDLIRGILSLTVGSIIGVFGPVLLAPADAKPSRPDPKTAPSTKPNQVRPKPKTASSLKPAAKP